MADNQKAMWFSICSSLSASTNCLEVGSGTGSVAQWLSARVGPIGKVVATDIDLRYLSFGEGFGSIS